MLRAINRIIYRYYNDGDEYFRGYGTETAGPAHSFLVNANTGVRSAMEKIFGDGTNYEDVLILSFETQKFSKNRNHQSDYYGARQNWQIDRINNSC